MLLKQLTVYLVDDASEHELLCLQDIACLPIKARLACLWSSSQRKSLEIAEHIGFTNFLFAFMTS